MDCSQPSYSVPEVSQTRMLEWVVISFSRGYSRSRDWTRISSTGSRILYHWATRGAEHAISSSIYISMSVFTSLGFPRSSAVKQLPARVRAAEGADSIPVLQSSQAGEMGTHSSVLAWDIPRAEKPGGLQYIGSQRVRHNWPNEHTRIFVSIHLSIYSAIDLCSYLWIQLFTAIKLSVYLLTYFWLCFCLSIQLTIDLSIKIYLPTTSWCVFIYMSHIYDIYMSYILYMGVHTHTHTYISLKGNQSTLNAH